ncbi:helix-turn-helix domain-containing protein [Ruegeria pomeroyi]|nr:helix-turn-helix domain-containing protein [Ruegeria pomeroyi]
MGTVSNALKMLDHFPLDSAGIGLSDLARASCKNKATVYRYLCELESNAFVEQDHETRKYRVGPALTRLAQGRKRQGGAREVIAPIVAALSARLNSWAILFDAADGSATPVALYHEGVAEDAGRVPIGSRLSLKGSSTGIVCHAFGNGFDTPEALKNAVLHCRHAGMARTPGAQAGALQSLSAPVFGSSGDLAFVATLVLPASDAHGHSIDTHETALCLTATAATVAIGGQPMQFHPSRRLQ